MEWSQGLHINLELLAQVLQVCANSCLSPAWLSTKAMQSIYITSCPSPAVGGPVEGSTEPYESIREDMVVISMATRLGNWKTQQSLHQQKMNEKV